jgi:hypothetical protein
VISSRYLMPEGGNMPNVPITRRTQPLGRAYDIQVIGDEDGFELHIETERGNYVVNVHGIAEHLLDAVNKEIGGWFREGRAAAADHQRDLDKVFDGDGIPTDDPKHPDWFSVHADAYDTMRGDR